MPKIKDSLRQLYHTHGAMTFLLAFYPLLPKMVELHTKSYLSLTRILTGSVKDIDEVIKIMFGKRGMKVYEEYKTAHPDQILSSDIFQTLYDGKNLKKSTALIEKLFFDKAQRTLPHADKNRAAIILATTNILRQFPKNTHQSFRDDFIRQLSNQAIIDIAIPSQLAYIDTAFRLLTQYERHQQSRHRRKLHFMFADIEGKIKAEIAGITLTSNTLRSYKQVKKSPIILTPENAASLHEVLLLLAISPAIEVRGEAKEAILQIQDLRNKTTKIKS